MFGSEESQNPTPDLEDGRSLVSKRRFCPALAWTIPPAWNEVRALRRYLHPRGNIADVGPAGKPRLAASVQNRRGRDWMEATHPSRRSGWAPVPAGPDACRDRLAGYYVRSSTLGSEGGPVDCLSRVSLEKTKFRDMLPARNSSVPLGDGKKPNGVATIVYIAATHRVGGARSPPNTALESHVPPSAPEPHPRAFAIKEALSSRRG